MCSDTLGTKRCQLGVNKGSVLRQETTRGKYEMRFESDTGEKGDMMDALTLFELLMFYFVVLAGAVPPGSACPLRAVVDVGECADGDPSRIVMAASSLWSSLAWGKPWICHESRIPRIRHGG